MLRRILMIVNDDILEQTCKDMIETILLCLGNARKGTIYKIGSMPELRTVRITSGIRNERSGDISWGKKEFSDYNFPGKSWEDYKDKPGRALEAMAWCVEKGKSWTADDPHHDTRSIRKQLANEAEDYHHMEPVLIKRSYLYGDRVSGLRFPVDSQGREIWKESENLVIAVIKIHFEKGCIARGDRSTKVIKKLSRTLGTQLLSLHIRETLAEAQQELARQRLRGCNVLAHELRNTLIKLGFIFSAINAEISFLREQWESQFVKAFPGIDNKNAILDKLNSIIETRTPGKNDSPRLNGLREKLISEQAELAGLPLMPTLGEKWVENKIFPKWMELIKEDTDLREEVKSLLRRLKEALWIGMDEELAGKIEHLPADLRSVWQKVAYVDFTVEKMDSLDQILRFLDHPDLKIPHKQQTRKVLTSLRALAEMIPEVEEKTNRIIDSLKKGSFDSM
jgi:hypothetical protein